MSKMRAIEAAVLVMRREGVDTAFGIPGAAINPLYSALQKVGGIDHAAISHESGVNEIRGLPHGLGANRSSAAATDEGRMGARASGPSGPSRHHASCACQARRCAEA